MFSEFFLCNEFRVPGDYWPSYPRPAGCTDNDRAAGARRLAKTPPDGVLPENHPRIRASALHRQQSAPLYSGNGPLTPHGRRWVDSASTPTPPAGSLLGGDGSSRPPRFAPRVVPHRSRALGAPKRSKENAGSPWGWSAFPALYGCVNCYRKQSPADPRFSAARWAGKAAHAGRPWPVPWRLDRVPALPAPV